MKVLFTLKFRLQILLILFSFAFASCDSINSIFDDENENDDTNNSTSSAIHKLIETSEIAELEYVVAIYCVEDGNDSLSVYDNYDYGNIYGNVNKLVISFDRDGTYKMSSKGSKDDVYEIINYDLEFKFSANREAIEYLKLNSHVYDLKFMRESFRDIQIEYEVFKSIPIVTANIDSIKINNRVEYRAEFIGETDFDFIAKESFPETDPDFSYHYLDTRGDNRHMIVYVYFYIN